MLSGTVLIAWCPVHGLHGERRRCYVCDEEAVQVPHVRELVARRLAERLADAATIAPGGTRWPGGYELPNDETCYALLGWLGENVYGGGSDPARAKADLVEKLLAFAEAEWLDPYGQQFNLLSEDEGR